VFGEGYLQSLGDYLGEIARSPFGLWLGLAFLATAVTFFITAAARDKLDQILSGGSSARALRMFDLSHGDAAGKLGRKVAVAPERLWTYDENYLEHFRGAAGNALPTYTNFVLRWDILFAFFLASFIVLFWLAVGSLSPGLSRLAIFCECMGILYGFADIAEDLKLISILDDPYLADHPDAIDPANAAAANTLTRIKIVSLSLSLVGLLVFAVVAGGDWLIGRLAHGVWEIVLALWTWSRGPVVVRPNTGDPAPG
jgi:hypothetical protein